MMATDDELEELRKALEELCWEATGLRALERGEDDKETEQ